VPISYLQLLSFLQQMIIGPKNAYFWLRDYGGRWRADCGGSLFFHFRLKRRGSTNNLQGFGIKLNVSYPSILLIVEGGGGLLPPFLFFPKASSAIKAHPTLSKTAESDTIEDLRRLKQERDAWDEPPVQPFTKPEQTTPVQRSFLSSGVWQLSVYSENGIDLSVKPLRHLSYC
jgi:hypothetical protein